jgi:hypothetical protein
MHMPDGFLDAKTNGTTAALAAAGAQKGATDAARAADSPMLGLSAAFLFAAQKRTPRTITLIYDHRTQHVQESLTTIQHDHHDVIFLV